MKQLDNDLISKPPRALMALVMALFVAQSYWVLKHPNVPAPDPKSQVGTIAVDLSRLDFSMTFRSLQSAGLFTESSCRKCDFSQGAKSPVVREQNGREAQILWRSGSKLNVVVFSGDVRTSHAQLENVIHALRTQYPNRDDAFMLCSGASECLAVAPEAEQAQAIIYGMLRSS